MDSHFFRCLAEDLGPLLSGLRIQKIFNPTQNVFTFELGAKGGMRYLLFHAHANHGALFLSADKPENPLLPVARAMWLRKYVSNRRLLEHVVDWPTLRIAWRVSGEPEAYLVFDMRQGVDLVERLESGFGCEPTWPVVQDVLNDSDIWRRHPQISPALRKAVAALAPAQAEGLLKQLQTGRCRTIYTYTSDKGVDALVWSLPVHLAQGKGVRVHGSALEAAAEVFRPGLFAALKEAERMYLKQRVKKERKRLNKLLKKLEREEARLQELIQEQEKAILLQSNLYALQAGEKQASVSVPDEQGRNVELELDDTLTVLENMERLFKLAAKGKRGMPQVAKRKRQIAGELEELLRTYEENPQNVRVRGNLVRAFKKKTSPKAVGKKSGTKNKTTDPALQRFRTSDGFIVYRGKNKAANHALVTKKSSSFDLWFHAQDGPGAHCILKRDYPEQDVPETSLREAAALAGLKSWQADADRARVICALIKDVRSIKGASMGRVRVDKLYKTLLVELDFALEGRLKID